ncbi:MAG TPA: glycosyltransferase family 4 protein [Salinivirgaceae bacterium]|nr:glycosyltransferase family 4 protein [Salinivirgaceae bacterium]
MKKKRILYLVPHRMGRSPGQRFRCEHFIPFLKESGYEITYSNILSAWDDKYFYSHRNYFIKLFIVVKSFIKRVRDIIRVKNYDAVFIYREAFMMGTVFFERIVKWLGAPIIFDFDDSIWLNDTSQGNQNVKWLKRPSKTADICKLATTVIVGNSYLAQYAKQYSKNVFIIPTTIDTDYHKPVEKTLENKNSVIIGWTGTSTTLKHLITIQSTLLNLKKRYGNNVKFSIIADLSPEIEGVEFEFVKWSLTNEIEQLSRFDIGIMPLPDNQWTRGKCGFKGLQYMALEIPSVMSPVGVNNDIVTNGENGYLASTDQEWLDVLSMLIENPELRMRIGKEGRKTVIEKFSVKNNNQTYLKVINSTIN